MTLSNKLYHSDPLVAGKSQWKLYTAGGHGPVEGQ